MRDTADKRVSDSFRIRMEYSGRIFKEVLARLRKLGNRITEEHQHCEHWTTWRGGQAKEAQNSEFCQWQSAACRLLWTSRCVCMQAAAPLDSLRGPFLKIEELNLWYNFRSKNNTKHVFTRDCQCRVVLSLEVPMAILMTGKI